jgi:hypothetical protein
MTRVTESLYVDCPYVRAREFLHAALAQASADQLPHLVRLKATVPATRIELAKYVNVRYSGATDPMHFDEPWRVRWTPEPGGIYPSFDGELTVRADETYRSAILELTGEYAPPLGAAGRVFDAAFGQRIAAGTAQELLARIAAEMEAQYHREEAAKADTLSS